MNHPTHPTEPFLGPESLPLRALVDNLPINLVLTDRQGRVTFGNALYLKTTGRTLAEVIGKTDFALFPEALAEKYWHDTCKVVETGEVFEDVERHRTSQGKVLYVQVLKTPMRDGQGAISGVQILFWDVTEREQAKEALRQQEGFIRNVLDTDPNLIFVKDHEGRYTLVNQAMARFFNRPAQQLVGVLDTDLNPDPQMAAQFRRDDLEVMATLKEKIIPEEKTENHQGDVMWLQTIKRPLLSEDGQARHLFGVAIDITARKRIEEQLRDSQALYQSLVDNLPANLVRKDLVGRITFGNVAFLKTMGKTAEEILGQTDFDLFPKALAEQYHQDDCRVLNTGGVFEDIEQLRTPASEELYIQVLKTPIRDTQGAITGLQVLFWDVTERERVKRELARERDRLRQAHDELEQRVAERTAALTQANAALQAQIAERERAERELAREHDLLRSLMDTIPDRIYFKDAQSRFVRCSKAVAADLGLDDPSQAVGKTDFEFFSDQHARPAFDDEQRIIHTGEPVIGLVEKEVWQDGHVAWVSTTKMPLRNQNGEIIGTFGISRDVTALKQAEAELDYERDVLETLLNNIPDAVYFKDRQSCFVRASRSLASMIGASCPEELKGKTDFDLFDRAHAQPAYDDEQRIMFSGEPLVGVVEKEVWKDGSVTWVLTSKMPWRNEKGEIIGTFGISKSITQLKQAELEIERAHQELLVTSRQAGMAEIATGILHNVGNVLNSVNVAATLIADKTKNSHISSLAKLDDLLNQHANDLADFITRDAKGRQIPSFVKSLSECLQQERAEVLGEVASLTQNIDHIKEIVAMQQNYALAAGLKETLPLRELVEDALRIHGGDYTRHGVRVIREFQELPPVTVDKHKVLQILVNLLSNAKYACDADAKEEKCIWVRIEGDEHQARVVVRDNGVGISPENLIKIFQHGFTTREGGHGFGLHNGANIAKELGGSLGAQSAGSGKGSAFTLELPVSPAVSPPVPIGLNYSLGDT